MLLIQSSTTDQLNDVGAEVGHAICAVALDYVCLQYVPGTGLVESTDHYIIT
jgi:hypothetical protein